MGNIDARRKAYAGQYRYFGPKLKPEEQRALLRLANAGDRNAGDTLQKHFERMLLRMVHSAINKFGGLERGKEPPGYYEPPRAPEFDDKFQAARVRLQEVIRSFDPDRQNGLNAYARRAIAGAIHDAVMHWRLRGQMAGTTGSERWSRADRWLYDNPWINERGIGWRRTTAEDIVKSVRCSSDSASTALASRIGYSSGADSYDTTEAYYDEEEEPHAFAGDQGPFGQKIDVGGDAERIREPQTQGDGLPKQAKGRRDKIYSLAIAEGLRAMRHLARIGRRKYANELVAKDRDAAANRPLQRHLYSGAVLKPMQIKHENAATKSDLQQIRDMVAAGKKTAWVIDDWRKVIREERELTPKMNASRRMASLVVAVDNGEPHGKYKHHAASLPGSDLRRVDRKHNRNIPQERRANR